MKKLIYKGIFLVLALSFFTSCGEDFLDRPPESQYTIDNFYKNEAQLELGVNPLYGGVWFDYQRSYINIGDVMAGNLSKASNPYYIFGVTPATEGLNDAYNSLWTAVAYANGIIENIITQTPDDLDEDIVNTYLGEALVWRAMAYFYLVRVWGAVPIIESNTSIIQSGRSNSLYKNRVEDVYKFITLTLEDAIEKLPETNKEGRINKWSAYGLLAKVYLTKSGYGQSGSRNQEDLDKAIEYAGKVVHESGLTLEPEYANLFTISKGNRNPENLISWHWVVVENNWGPQNALQADLAVQNLTGHGDGWGTWSGPSIFLQEMFGEDATKILPEERVNTDTRRKATMMMNGDYYSELRAEDGGFGVFWDGGSIFASNTGAWARKHIVGHYSDHEREAGHTSQFMKTSLSTHLLRLADVYLIYAEAIVGNSTEAITDADALAAYNSVRRRAIPTQIDATDVSFDDIFDERIRELSFEGDNWFDYVRLHYYDPTEAKQKIADQERGYYDGNAANPELFELNSEHYTPLDSDFELPFPEVDLSINPRLLEDPVPYDFGDSE